MNQLATIILLVCILLCSYWETQHLAISCILPVYAARLIDSWKAGLCRDYGSLWETMIDNLIQEHHACHPSWVEQLSHRSNPDYFKTIAIWKPSNNLHEIGVLMHGPIAAWFILVLAHVAWSGARSLFYDPWCFYTKYNLLETLLSWQKSTTTLKSTLICHRDVRCPGVLAELVQAR